ncbi:hypothetical protein H1P_850026 [Hyella patelloides LEGE 07179]|uniref:Uncharacterized protein n=1 Tax=Hyella patelloides LEGE 07179 TaxID=945734 RepID=A0A563W4N9_9CYAN|nr:hypothetical protein H1P_850026 [Hyella patelloides LEGE 07179]
MNRFFPAPYNWESKILESVQILADSLRSTPLFVLDKSCQQVAYALNRKNIIE